MSMIRTLGVYSKDLEPMLLARSRLFFEQWAKKTSSRPLGSYTSACHTLIAQELDRCDQYGLEPSTKRDLIKLMDLLLVAEQKDRLLREGDVTQLLESTRLEPTHQLYLLLRRQQLGDDLRAPFERYIISKGCAIIFDPQREGEMVVRLLRFKQQLDRMWEKCFHRSEVLGHALRGAFETFINRSEKSDATWGTDNSKPGEMIAKYVDVILRGGIKALEIFEENETETSPPQEDDLDDEAENDALDEEARIRLQLDQVLDLFRFVHGKAVFEAFYKKDLARRLLLDRSASADAEKSMLTRLTSGMCYEGLVLY